MAVLVIEHRLERDVLVLSTRGYLDRDGGQALRTACLAQATPTLRGVVFNFAGSPVINSSGLSAVLDLVGRLTEPRDLPIAVCGLSSLARSAFRTAGILALVREHPGEETAVLAVAGA